MASRPRQPVTKGGLWSTAKQPVSKETRELLKVMMKESKLTNFQQRQLCEKLDGGHSFPTEINPTSSARTETCNKAKPTSKTAKRQSSGTGKRTQAAIQQRAEKNDEEPYRPPPGKCITEKDKQHLQNTMAYGEDGAAMIEEAPRRKPQTRVEINEPDIDRFDEVMQLIEERKQFLDDMEKLGQGKKYRNIIAAEISQGIRELELIDKKRTQELNLVIEQDKTP